MRMLYTILMSLLYCAVSHAQDVSEVYVTSDTLHVFFRQDKIVLDAGFRDNGLRLQEFTRRFRKLKDDPASKVRSILIVSGASPEGSTTRNRYLSDNRARVVYDYLTGNHLVDSAHIEIESRGVDWKGLETFVRASDLPYKEEVLEILALPEWISRGGRVADGRKSRLMNYRGGKVWNELYDRYFPDLRGTRVMIAWNILRTDTVQHIAVPPIEPVKPCLAVELPVLPMPVLKPLPVEPPKKRKKPLRLAVKSNLLYDAVLIPNIGAEIGVWRGLTIGGSYQNIWLRDGGWTRWYRLEGFEAELKYYINKVNRPFRGHHVGIYGQMLTWDFTIDGRGYLAERWAYGGGISYGYALPIGRRFNLDFEVGIGYLHGNMHEYIPQDGHRVWQKYEPFDWIGPTKLGVTLQWLIGRDNENVKKERRAKR